MSGIDTMKAHFQPLKDVSVPATGGRKFICNHLVLTTIFSTLGAADHSGTPHRSRSHTIPQTQQAHG
jgi:hypothetical protein